MNKHSDDSINNGKYSNPTAAESADAGEKKESFGSTDAPSSYQDLDDYVFYTERRRRTSSTTGHRKHRKKRKRRRMKRWKKVCIGIIAGLLSLIIAMLAAAVVMVNMGKTSLLDNDLSIAVPEQAEAVDGGMYIIYNGTKYKYNENITSILCMGIDHENLGTADGDIGTGGEADSLFLLSIDVADGRTHMINISRETMTDIGIYSIDGSYVESRKAQLCLAYAYGDGKETSCHNQLVAVRQLFYNIPINSYLSMDLQGIAPINDTVGGVTVTSPETVGSFKEGETLTLQGDLSREFVQSRSHKTVEGNSLRMERQRVYLEAFASKVISLTMQDLSTPLTVFNAATPYICTDVTASKTAYLAVNALRGNIGDLEIQTVPGKVKQGEKYAEFYVDEDKFFELFLSVYYIPMGRVE